MTENALIALSRDPLSGRLTLQDNIVRDLGPGNPKLAQDPGRSRVHAATSLTDSELSDAIHIFERASAMKR